MKTLNYNTLKENNYKGYLLESAPERILQFGEGNFLRAFVDYFIDMMNELADFQSKVVICQPIAPGLSDLINQQEGLYTLYLRGYEKGEKVNQKRVISCVSRCINPYSDFNALMQCAANPELRFIACNTTEAGIVYDSSCKFTDTPASSYPGKLTQFLYERFTKFSTEKGKGFVILSCELIDDNGKELLKCVEQYCDLWKLGDDFKAWIRDENIFCSTLVDRIVTGYPHSEAEALWAENGYVDNLINTGEIFGFWVIEGPESLKKELPFEKAGLPVLITNNHKPYKQRKVRILNGAHTTIVPGAFLAGYDIVRDCMEDSVIQNFMNQTIFKEIIPTLTLPEKELQSFADSVLERFKNPFIDHALLSICLNSTSKWKARVLPSLKEYLEKFNQLPECICASFAFYISFYKNINKSDGEYFGLRDGKQYSIKDDDFVLEFFYEHRGDSLQNLTKAVCSNTEFWGENLCLLDGFENFVSSYLNMIEENGTYQVMKDLISQ